MTPLVLAVALLAGRLGVRPRSSSPGQPGGAVDGTRVPESSLRKHYFVNFLEDNVLVCQSAVTSWFDHGAFLPPHCALLGVSKQSCLLHAQAKMPDAVA